jgi:UDP-sugar transporter A1/2/3
MAPDLEAALVTGEKPKQKVEVATTQSGSNDRFKWFVLVFLVVQNSSASILMRDSRSEVGASWNPQTGVVMQEVIKALACVVLLLKEGGLHTVFADRKEALKTAIPAICYLIQNNLQYVAVGYLDASTYAVLYQLKILTTALLSVVILRKDLVCIQWVSLGLLTIGVSAVVLSQMSGGSGDEGKSKGMDTILPGLAAVLTACLMSGLAGVYFEKLLKGSTVSLWARNLQLALYSIVIGLIGLCGESSSRPAELRTDFFHGYTAAVWLSILNNAFGGLLVAIVIKYADVILKNFAASLSIILTACISAIAFNTSVSSWFTLGTCMVIYAMFLYGKINPMDLVKKFTNLETNSK